MLETPYASNSWALGPWAGPKPWAGPQRWRGASGGLPNPIIRQSTLAEQPPWARAQGLGPRAHGPMT